MLQFQGMPALEGHTATVCRNYLIVYGGKSGATTLNGDAFALNLDTNAWNRLLISGESPVPRAYHTACCYRNRLYIFGGLVAVGVDDIHFNAYNMLANVDALPQDLLAKPWEERIKDQGSTRYVTQQRLESTSLHCLNLEGGASWSQVATHGLSPATRSHHNACIFRNTMFIYGGYSCHTSGRMTDEEFKSLYHVYGLNLETNVWTVYDVPQSPPRRFGSTASVFGPYWLFQGGVDVFLRCETNETWIFHLEEGGWRRIPQHVVPPLAFSSSAVFGDTMYVLGGSSDRSTRFHPRMYCFDLIKGYWWHKVMPEFEGPPPHGKGALTVAGRYLIATGGLSVSFRRIESSYRFDIASGLWSELPTKFDTELLDNVIGVERAAFQVQPMLGAAQSVKLTVSQGAQTSSTSVDVDTLDMSTGGPLRSAQAAKSALGGNVKRTSTMQDGGTSSFSGQVWAGTSQNDELFGITGAMQIHRAAALKATDSTLAAVDRAASLAVQLGSARGRAEPLASPEAGMPTGHTRLAFQEELDARFKRLKDMTSAPADAQERIHSYWQSELAQLADEHHRWREAAVVDRDMIRLAVSNMDDVPNRPNRWATDEGASSAKLREAVRVQPLMKAGFVSPSIMKLGLADELSRVRNAKQ